MKVRGRLLFKSLARIEHEAKALVRCTPSESVARKKALTILKVVELTRKELSAHGSKEEKPRD